MSTTILSWTLGSSSPWSAIGVPINTGTGDVPVHDTDSSATAHYAAVTGTQTLNVSHTTNSLTHGILLLGVSIDASAANTTVTGATYNGVALTKLTTVGTTIRTEIWSLKLPSTGTFNIVISLSKTTTTDAGVVAGATTFGGINQTSPFGSAVPNSATSSSATATVTNPAAGGFDFGVVTVAQAISATINTTSGGQPLAATWNTTSGTGTNDVRGAGQNFQAGAFAVPTVTTQAASSVGTTTATGNGNITNLGGATFCDQRGVVYDTVTHTLPGNVAPGSSGYASNVTETGVVGTGAFTEAITGLSGSTTYFTRSFAHNSIGYAYGAEVTFTTSAVVSPPTVTTQAASSVGTTTATGNGNITNLGGAASCDHRGVVYDTSSQSAPGNVAPGSSGYASNVDEAGSFTTGAFTEAITALSATTAYFTRSYAHNTSGYAYGAEVTFTTSGGGGGGNNYPGVPVFFIGSKS